MNLRIYRNMKSLVFYFCAIYSLVPNTKMFSALQNFFQRNILRSFPKNICSFSSTLYESLSFSFSHSLLLLDIVCWDLSNIIFRWGMTLQMGVFSLRWGFVSVCKLYVKFLKVMIPMQTYQQQSVLMSILCNHL